MRNKSVLSSLIVCCFLFCGCQKELTDQSLPEFCGVTSVTVTDGTTNTVTAVYTFTYDTVIHKPSILKYQNFPKGISRTINPTYTGDSIYLGSTNFITLDGTGKISILNERNSLPGINNGDYYYEYNTQGQLEQKLLDNGIDDAARTNFTYKNDTLVAFRQDIPNFQQGLSASLTYSNTLQLKGFSEFAAVEIFPELLLYMPCIKLGKLSSTPLAQITSNIAEPSSTSASNYGNYILTQEGWLSSFEVTTPVNGQKPIKTIYSFEYECYK